MSIQIAVIGAGIAGLVAARELDQRGIDFRVLEAAPYIGGLARTAQFDRWRYDFGVKALYSKQPAVMDYLRGLPITYCEHQRRVKVHHLHAGQGIDIEYPFENGIGELPQADKTACVLGYLEAHIAAQPVSNFYEWIVNRLGYGIAEQFMLPYNQKIWDCPLPEISLGLVSGKIHPAPWQEIVRIALGEKIVGRQYQAQFIYPREGMSALMDAIAQPVADRIRLGFRVTKILPRGAGYTLVDQNGAQVDCTAIISTVPLPQLYDLVPGDMGQRPAWRYNNTRFYIVLLNTAPPQDLHWQFFAAPEFPFYRLTYMHNFSDRFAPCIVAEVTERGQPRETEGVLTALAQLGVARSWVEGVRVERLDYTYPIPTLKSDREKPAVIQAFEQRHIYPLGRAGAWNYTNVDGVILQAWEKVPALLAQEHLL